MTVQRICLLTATLVASLGPLVQMRAADPTWKLVWQDEFNGPKLDYSKWEAAVNAFGGGNNELQMFTDSKENVRIEDGQLVLEARRGPVNVQGTVRDYSSARLRTKNRGDWKYGRFEIKARMPKGQGIWPAIWMMPTEETYGPWASSGEIDILEVKGHDPARFFGTLHFGEPWPKNASSGGEYVLPNSDFAAAFHLFALEWEEKEIRWYIDDQLIQSKQEWSSSGGPYPAPFNQPFHLVLNIAVGGGFVGAPDSTTVFPQRMTVDYVRVYQR